MSGFTHTQLFWDHWAKLGGCTKCMRQSCAVCIGSWIGLILALWIGAAALVRLMLDTGLRGGVGRLLGLCARKGRGVSARCENSL
jgi:hypothetical protein